MSSKNASKPSSYRYSLPSNDQIKQSRILIQKYKEEIKDFETRLNELQSLSKETTDLDVLADFTDAIQDLSIKMETAKKHTTEQEAFIAPIRRLPAELLALILVFYAADNGNSHFTVILVCRSWHHVALSTPLMWSTINVVAPYPPNNKPHPSVWYYRRFNGGVSCDRYEQLKFALERSGVVPLDIRLETSEYSHQFKYSPVMKLLWTQNGHRCRHFELKEHPAFDIPALEAGWPAIPTSLPLLQSIKIESDHPSTAIRKFLEVAQQTSLNLHTIHISHVVPPCLMDMPELIRRVKHLTWCNSRPFMFDTPLRNIWTNSTRLESLVAHGSIDSPFREIQIQNSDRHYTRLHTLAMTQTRIEGIEKCGKQLISLTHVAFRHMSWMMDQAFQPHSIRLPAVTHFTLVGISYQPLSYFVLPSLESLELYGCSQNTNDAGDILDLIWNPDTFGKSPCPSRALHLETLANDAYVLAALRSMQDIKQISLYYDNLATLGPKLMASLAKPPKAPKIPKGGGGEASATTLRALRAPQCPSLEELKVVCRRASAKDQEICTETLGKIQQARLGTASEMRCAVLVLGWKLGVGSENKALKLALDLD